MEFRPSHTTAPFKPLTGCGGLPKMEVLYFHEVCTQMFCKIFYYKTLAAVKKSCACQMSLLNKRIWPRFLRTSLCLYITYLCNPSDIKFWNWYLKKKQTNKHEKQTSIWSLILQYLSNVAIHLRFFSLPRFLI